MSNKRPQAVKIRTDLTDYLWHFTRADKNPEQTLKEILSGTHLKSSPCFPGPHRVICFTETPLAESIKQSPVLQQEGYPRLSTYGIGFSKTWFFNKGGLPAIYQPRRYYQNLPEALRFRHVDFDLSVGLDFSWQREWRVELEQLQFTRNEAIVVVPKMSEFEDVLWEHDFDVEVDDGVPLYSHTITPLWKFVAIDEFDDINELNEKYLEIFSPNGT